MIYLDHNATTPVHPRVFDAMVPYLRERFGNASSFYRLGRSARKALEESRARVAGCIHADPREIIFTGSGTESDNLAVRGPVLALREKGNHVITSAVEHHAVLKTCESLEKEGCRVTYLPVDSGGRVDPDDVRKSITPQTVLVSIMYANNETGVIQPVAEIGAIAREQGVLFHTDAVQAAGKIPIDAGELHADLLSVSAHKMYGPKGVGALFVRQGTPLFPQVTGGPHERGLRAGTENIANIVGLAEAFTLASGGLEAAATRLAQLRDRLEKRILESIGGVRINGVSAPRVPNTSNISFLSIDGESLLLHLDLKNIYASSGSACTTGSAAPSAVLLAMGVAAREAQGAIRFSLGAENSEQDIDATVAALQEATQRLRSISSIRDE